MEVNVKQAIKLFFSKSSFEMIFLEAFANALDAGATKFEIDIELPDFSQLQNLRIRLIDNGIGFNDSRFDKFSKLLEVEETSHKGLGRLVYLCYFDSVNIESFYDNGKKRTFLFHDDYEKDSIVEDTSITVSGSCLTLTGFNGERLKKNENIRVSFLKRLLLENFYMRFYNAKLSNQHIIVTIKSIISGKEETEIITGEDLPSFKLLNVEEGLGFFDNVEIYYHVSKIENGIGRRVPTFITALSIDDRCMPVEVVSKENVSQLYDMIFLLKSASLQGSTDESRQNIKIEERKLKYLISVFRSAINQIVKKEIPQIADANEKLFRHIQEQFPHLEGLIDEDIVGYLPYHEVVKRGQDKFFRTEREILGATELTEEQFEKSIEYSSRSLATYIIYRQKLIERMRKLSHADLESDLHNLLSVKYKKFSADKIEQDVYLNNVWVLDDKFMTYNQVLSEAKMDEVIGVISPNSSYDGDNDRPDISIFFSNDPNNEEQTFDIVIVELKRLGITAENNSIVEFQLDTRTQALAKYFGNRIQRAWFYGIVDMDDRYKLHLKNQQYKPLFSHGNIYYRSKIVYSDLEESVSVIQNSYIMDFKALVEDANSRNNTFLKLLREKFSTKSPF